MTTICRAWLKLAPKLVAFLGGGLTPTALIAAYAWAADGFGWSWQPSPALAALVVTALATIAGWWKTDGALAGRTWSEISPKLLVLIVSSGLVTITIAIIGEVGIVIDPRWAALIATVLPLIPGYFKADTIAEGGVNPAHFYAEPDTSRHLA